MNIYSGTGDKWRNIGGLVVIALIGYMTSFGLCDNPDPMMEAVQNVSTLAFGGVLAW